jgi:hypothetical protein
MRTPDRKVLESHPGARDGGLSDPWKGAQALNRKESPMQSLFHSRKTQRCLLAMAGGILVSCFLAIPAQAQEMPGARQVYEPLLDAQGRFWLYQDRHENNRNDPWPFIPYGWMPGYLAERKMIVMNTEWSADPYIEPPREQTPEDRCILIRMRWLPPLWTWSGIAFLAGPDGSDPLKPAWWGADNRGWFYDVSKLKHRRLVFFARGKTGKEKINVEVGTLAGKNYGDSLLFPEQTGWRQLQSQWTRYELDLSKKDPEELKAICSGITVLAAQDEQEDKTVQQVEFYLDSIYWE